MMDCAMTETSSQGPEKPAGGPAAEKAVAIQQMFNRIAPTYDFLNDCISFGMHRLWKNTACRMLNLSPGNQVLDVCTGTGDLVTTLLKHVGPAGRVVGVDFSEEMLTVARNRFSPLPQAEFVQGDALNLPFDDNRFDGAIVSFGLRNVVDIPRAVQEMARVVRPGGWVVNLDTCPKPKMPGYWFYFSQVMPRIGQLFSMDAQAYQYLSDSTKTFLSPDELKAVFEGAGLNPVISKTLMMGSVSLQAGQKPLV
jgi:demethylmenaquinone methyltransferase/2-methoxy-6-polyprenyl-1,4-benzoquinol methylase